MYLIDNREAIVLEISDQAETNWYRSCYRAAFNDGIERWINGISNGFFGLSDEYVLTHLATGFKITRFQCEESGKKAGDYLRDIYADEFAVLVSSIEPLMTWDQYKTLPSAKNLSYKIQADVFFSSMLAEYQVKDERE